MHASHDEWSRQDRGPAVYYGYCGRTRRFRMMDLPDYLSNAQQGMSRLATDPQGIYQEMIQSYYGPSAAGGGGVHGWALHDCGCHGGRDCHCECCVSDADVLVHARCGEVRRIPVTFENDTRRERNVTLELGQFAASGGTDLKWNAQLSEQAFTLAPCGEHTVIVTVRVECDGPDVAGAVNERGVGTVDRCRTGYATLRAEGCLVRPAVLAVAVLPDDCDSYRRPCSCGCCN